jgi:glycerol-1-phosphate dehydrogenase [NAD(P)+]
MPASDPIAALIAGTYVDHGAALQAETRAVVIEDSLAGREAELIAPYGARFAVISDVDTHAAMGAQVVRALGRFEVQSIVLDRRPHCEAQVVDRLVQAVAPCDAVIAVGSGTLNDLAKLVGLRKGVPSLVFGTAPSMNGYTSVSASVSEAGVKRSVRARTPMAVFLDLGVLAAAPVEMIRAGLGDSVCRPTAQADWLLSHLLLDTPYLELPFALLATEEPALFEQAPGLVRGDRMAMRSLARTLVLSGFGMTLSGGSFPASQGEHLISHYLEMMRPVTVIEAFHGEQVGVAALAMARLQTTVLARTTTPKLRPIGITLKSVLDHFGPERGAAVWSDVSAKQVDIEVANARLESDWPAMRARLAAIVQPPERLAAVLSAAGAPTTPAALGYPDALFGEAFAHARELRDRYTFLDFAADLVPVL